MDYSPFECVRVRQEAAYKIVTKTNQGWIHTYYPHNIFAKKKRNGRKMRAYRASNTTCEVCVKVKSEHTHHIKPLSLGGSDEPDNLMAVCVECHDKLHPEFSVGLKKV